MLDDVEESEEGLLGGELDGDDGIADGGEDGGCEEGEAWLQEGGAVWATS